MTRRDRFPWATASWVALVFVTAFGFHELETLIREEAAEERVEEARACVTSHDRYREVRSVIHDAAVAGADLGAGAVAEVAGATPEQLARARRYIADHADPTVGEIVDLYEPPECDLAAARALLDDPPEEEDP